MGKGKKRKETPNGDPPKIGVGVKKHPRGVKAGKSKYFKSGRGRDDGEENRKLFIFQKCKFEYLRILIYTCRGRSL